MKGFLKKCLVYVVILVLSVLIEIFIFNYSSIKTNKLETKIILPEDMKLSGIVEKDNCYFIKENSASIEISNINMKIKSIYFNINVANNNEVKFDLYYTDESSQSIKQNYRLNRREITMLNTYERSKYVPSDFIGNTNKIRLVFNNLQGKNINIDKIVINKQIPFLISNSIIRICIMCIFAVIIYSLINEEFFKKEYATNNKLMKAIIVLIAILFIEIMFSFTIHSGSIYMDKILDEDYYATSFIDSLIEGKVNLPQTPSEGLVNMENPYDFSQRQGKVQALWDVVYYKGKYYLYFGILPAVLLFLPLKVIFNYQLTSVIALVIFNILSIIMSCKLILEIIKRWFKNTKFNLICVLMVYFLFTSKLLWITARPEFYEMIISAGYLFIISGMYFAFKSNLFNNDGEKIKYKFLMLACICLALAIGCRPTTLLISILILPGLIKLFINAIKQFKNDKKEICKFILCCALPYIIVGIILMSYNYARFENPFEFGSSYQLTVTDNRNMTFSLSRSVISLCTNLFNVPIITYEFPFVFSNDATPFYQGIYYDSPVGGGICIVGTLSIVILLLPFIYKELKKKNKMINLFIVLSLVIAIIMLCVSGSMAGNAGRYLTDCAWLFNLSAILIVLFLNEKIKDDFSSNMFFRIILLLVVLSCVMNYLLAITGENNIMYYFAIETFYKLKYLFSFWM